MLHTRSRTVRFHYTTPLKIHRTVPVEIHWASDNIWNIQMLSDILLEHATDNLLENATGDPRSFLRC